MHKLFPVASLILLASWRPGGGWQIQAHLMHRDILRQAGEARVRPEGK